MKKISIVILIGITILLATASYSAIEMVDDPMKSILVALPLVLLPLVAIMAFKLSTTKDY